MVVELGWSFHNWWFRLWWLAAEFNMRRFTYTKSVTMPLAVWQATAAIPLVVIQIKISRHSNHTGRRSGRRSRRAGAIRGTARVNCDRPCPHSPARRSSNSCTPAAGRPVQPLPPCLCLACQVFVHLYVYVINSTHLHSHSKSGLTFCHYLARLHIVYCRGQTAY